MRCAQPDVGRAELAQLDEAGQVGEDRLRAAVLIGTVEMQSVATSAGVRIDQRNGEVIGAKIPGERPSPFSGPVDRRMAGTGRRMRRGAGRDRSCGFEGLLVEGFGWLSEISKTVDPDGAEETGFRRLQRHQPGEASETRSQQIRVAQRGRGQYEGLRETGVVIGQPLLEPDPVWRFVDDEQIGQSVCEAPADGESADIVRSAFAVGVEAQKVKVSKAPSASRKSSAAQRRRVASSSILAHTPNAQSVRPWLSSEPSASNHRRSKLMKLRKRRRSGFQAC